MTWAYNQKDYKTTVYSSSQWERGRLASIRYSFRPLESSKTTRSDEEEAPTSKVAINVVVETEQGQPAAAEDVKSDEQLLTVSCTKLISRDVFLRYVIISPWPDDEEQYHARTFFLYREMMTITELLGSI